MVRWRGKQPVWPVFKIAEVKQSLDITIGKARQESGLGKYVGVQAVMPVRSGLIRSGRVLGLCRVVIEDLSNISCLRVRLFYIFDGKYQAFPVNRQSEIIYHNE